MTSRTSDDPDQILNCDPAAVAIRASHSYDTLQKLKECAQQLTKYVGLMEDARVVDLSQDDDDIDDELVVETPPAVAGLPRPVTMMPHRRGTKSRETTSAETSCREKRKVSQRRDRQEAIPGELCRGSMSQDNHDDDHVETSPFAIVARRAPPAMVPRRRVRKITTATDETINDNNIGRGDKRKASQTAPHRLGLRLEDNLPHRALKTDTRSISRPLANSKKSYSPQAAARPVQAKSRVAIDTPSTNQKQSSSDEDEEGDDDDENDEKDEDYQPGERLVCETVASNSAIGRAAPRKVARRIAAVTPSPKCKRPPLSTEHVKDKIGEELSTKEANEPEMSHRFPRKLAPGIKADLKNSLLERSAGRTRKILNEHLEYLGLTAKFNVPVVSKHGSCMSHLTFKSAWNDLPQSQDETLEYWLGEGSKRIALASPLDPSIQEQPLEGIPVFWATPHTGADLCYYVGHFRCINFFKTRRVVMMERPRQALIELQFVKFDESLAQKIASLS
jgi:hypothetical protein